MSTDSLESQIEDLISNDAPDFEVSKVLKKSIKEYLKSLDVIFESNQGKDFLVKHTKTIDMFLKVIYKYIIRKSFGNYLPLSNSIPITLVALGSYGREQLCVYSDIDLMFVYKDLEGYNPKPLIEKMLYIAWDSGLKLGHRVHEVGELNKVAQEDITIKSSLIESRFICGSKLLYGETDYRLKMIRQFKQKEFVVDKLKEYNDRQDKYDFNMEPDIKEGIGGLRDANTLFWIANAKHNVKNIKQLNEYYNIFGAEEYKEFRISLEFLFRVRSALHLVANKKQDKLILQYIPDIAQKLGFKDKATVSAQNQLVSKTFASLKNVHLFSKVFINKISRSLLFDSTNYTLFKNNRVEKGVFFVEDKVYASYMLKPKHIDEVLEIILKLPDREIKFGAGSMYLVKRSIFDEKTTDKTKKLLIELFKREYTSNIIQMFFDTEILHKLIKQFKKVLHLPQFDGYHKHPVTIHSIKSLYSLEHIKSDFVQKVYDNLSENDKLILKIVTLLHDAGKGRNADHSLVGEKLYKIFTKKLGFDTNSINDGGLLIKNHTLMSYVANKEDIYNEKTILLFTSRIGQKRLIDMLYVLTYADINGVGEDVYTAHSHDLLAELYLSSSSAVDKEELVRESARRIRKENAIKKDETFLSFTRLFQKKILSIKSNLLFIKYHKKEIIDIATMAKDVDTYKYKISNEKYLSVEIVRNQPLNLGYLLGKLSFLSIKNLDIFRLFDDKKYFKIDFSNAIDEGDMLFVEEVINNSFDMTKDIKLKKPTIDDITVDTEHSNTLAKIVLKAKDQKGLFAYLAKLFDFYQIDIETAKIYSDKNRALDVFLVEKSKNFEENLEKFLVDIRD
jgi:[protein-PII] uridylyltransferase